MRLLLTAGFIVCAQLALGAPAIAAGARLARVATRHPWRARRRLLAWRLAGGALLRACPWAAGAATAAAVALWWSSRPLASLDLGVWIEDWRFVATGVLPTSCCYLALHAGRLERAGRLLAARSLIRLAGLLLFAGVFALLILVWRDLLFEPAFRKAVLRGSPAGTWSLLLGMVALGCAGFVGAVAGLAGKPRPSSSFAVGFYLCGLWGLILAGHQWGRSAAALWQTR